MRFLAALTLSLVAHGAMAAGVLGLGGVGGPGNSGPHPLTPPTLTPMISSNMNPNQVVGLTYNALYPNNGGWGSMEFPASDGLASAAFYFEMAVDQDLGFGQTYATVFSSMDLDDNFYPGQPNFFFNRQWNGVQPGSWWWLNPGTGLVGQASASNPNSNYAAGFFPFTAPTTPNCTGRQPTGVWLPDYSGYISYLQQLDPGTRLPDRNTDT